MLAEQFKLVHRPCICVYKNNNSASSWWSNGLWVGFALVIKDNVDDIKKLLVKCENERTIADNDVLFGFET